MATIEDELLGVERAGWRALAVGADAAEEHYRRLLADDIVVLLPGGLVIADREEMIESMRGPPWDRYELSHERVLRLGGDTAVVIYRAQATRAGKPYTAWLTSTYVRGQDGWRLVVHQQTAE